jgi:cobalt-zinc-cadmium efflux system protein
MSHQHANAGGRAGARYRGRLAGAFGIISVFFVVELIGGFLTGSLALLSDAGHMFTDVLGLGMALAAIQAADRAARHPQRTFGLYRLEVIAALANAVLLFGVALYVLYEAYRRFQDPSPVLSGPMLAVAIAGLGANLAAFALLHRGAAESLNVQAAFLEVWADTLGSIGVILAAVIIRWTDWWMVDPLLGAGIGFFVLPRSWNVARHALSMLIQSAPGHIDVARLTRALEEIAGVEDVHDVHVWSLTSEMEVASAHLAVAHDEDSQRVLHEARRLLRERFGVDHATVQVEVPGICEHSLDW